MARFRDIRVTAASSSRAREPRGPLQSPATWNTIEDSLYTGFKWIMHRGGGTWFVLSGSNAREVFHEKGIFR